MQRGGETGSAKHPRESKARLGRERCYGELAEIRPAGVKESTAEAVD